MVTIDPGSAAEQFRAAWDVHHQRIRQYMVRRASVDDVDELTAQVFEVAWRRWGDVPTGETQLWWLLAVAHRTVGNYYRGRNRRGRLGQKIASVSSDDTVDFGWSTVESADVRRAVGALSESDREILLLAVWDDLDIGAISNVLGIGVAAAQKRLTRARERFKTMYEKFDRQVSESGTDRTLRR